MWVNDNLLLHFELSTRCNAYCPGCPRYVNSSTVLQPNLIQDNISFTQFKSWCSPNTLNEKVKRIMFCGNYGDPVANPEIVEILDYVVTHIHKDAYIVMNTNGGLGSTKQWKDIGNILKNNDKYKVFFSVDGLEETNHLYRRGVLWNRVDENIRAYTSTGAKGIWDYLVFEYNKHQVEQAKIKCKEWGLKDIRFKEPYGFFWNNKYHERGVYDKQGKLLYKLSVSPDSIDTVKDKVDTTLPRLVNENINETKFKCKSLLSWGTELMIHVDGTVFPCCYIGDLYNRYVEDPSKEELGKLFDVEKMNLQNESFNSILKYFDSNMWKSFTPRICSKECGVA